LIRYAPRWKFADGLREVLTWASRQQELAVRYEQSLPEMKGKGLLHG
jgi:hypothetical protein